MFHRSLRLMPSELRLLECSTRFGVSDHDAFREQRDDIIALDRKYFCKPSTGGV